MKKNHKKLSEEERIQYNFNVKRNNSQKLFEALPTYPEATSISELAKEFKVNSTKIIQYIRGLPRDAPVLEYDGKISRYK